MVVNQAILVNLKKLNSVSKINDATVSGKIINISNGVLSVDVGGDIYRLLPEDGNFKVGELVKFLLTDGSSNAQIINEVNIPLMDNISLSIDADIKDLLSLLDTTINNLTENKLKEDLLLLFNKIKHGKISTKNINKIINELKTYIQDKHPNIQPEIKGNINQIIKKIDSIKSSSFVLNKKNESFVSINGIKELNVKVRSNQKERVFIYETLKDLNKNISNSGELITKGIKDLVKIEKGIAHVIPQGNGNAELQLLDSEDLKSAFKYFTHSQFNSSFFKEQFSNEILNILKQKIPIDINTLKVLDSIFVKNPSLTNSDLSNVNKTNVFTQIFSLANSIGDGKIPLLEKIIPLMINSFKYDIETLIDALNGERSKSIQNLLQVLESGLQKDDKKEFLSLLFSLIGINRESDFSKDVLLGKGFLSSELKSIKDILLNILQNDEDPRTTGKDSRNLKDENLKAVRNAEIVEHKTSDIHNKHKQSFELKNKIEQVINKIEALQVLAKKSSALGVDSQLISVPLNINNEWAELRVQINKKSRDKKNKKQSNRTSVQMNIELSVIGEISAEMDFLNSKDLSINMILSNKSTMEWFESKRDDILSSIEKYGFNSIQLKFKLIEDIKDEAYEKKVTDRLDVSA